MKMWDQLANKYRPANSPKIQLAFKRSRGFLYSLLRAFLIFGLSFIILYPVLYMVSVSIREPSDLLDPTVIWIPKTLTMQNFSAVIKYMEYWSGLLRTMALSLGCSLLQTLSCAIAGYGFARFRFKGRSLLFFAALLTLIVPPQSINMPLYINYVQVSNGTGIQIIDTVIPMMLPALFGTGLRAGLFIYVYRQFFKGMPPEMEEAAYLDGCGPVSAFFRIMLVNAGSAILITFLLSFVWYWNDYLNTSLFYTSSQPLAVTLANFSSVLTMVRTENGALSQTEVSVYLQVAALLFITPVLIVYLFLQRRFTESIVRAGIVG